MKNPFNPMRFTGKNGVLTIEESSRLQDLIKTQAGTFIRNLQQIFEALNVSVTNVSSTPGVQGLMGIPGVEGADGEPGPPGPVGARGVDGAAGRPGPDGQDGEEGAPGPPGATGPAGATGSIGATGSPGRPGMDGEDGADSFVPGPSGPAGAAGANGSAGAAGAQGAMGPPGRDGEDDGDSMMFPPGAAAITWPLANRVMVSSGPTTTPLGNSSFQFDVSGTRVLYMGSGSSQSWSNTGDLGETNADRVTAAWGTIFAATTWIVKSEKAGSGTVRPMALNADTSALYLVATGSTGQVAMGNNPGSTPTLTASLTQMIFKGDVSGTTGAGMTYDGMWFRGGTITFSGATHVTTSTGVNMVAMSGPTYTTSATIDFSSTLAIYGPPTMGGAGTLTNAYSLWVQTGTTRMDGDAMVAGIGKNLGFFGNVGTTIQTVTGSRGGNVALLSLLTKLASYALIIDSTTA